VIIIPFYFSPVVTRERLGRDDSSYPSDSRHDRTNYTIFNMLERVQDVGAALVVFENGLLFITAGGDVMDCDGDSMLRGRAKEGLY